MIYDLLTIAELAGAYAYWAFLIWAAQQAQDAAQKINYTGTGAQEGRSIWPELEQ